MTRSQGRRNRAWAVQVVHIADPDITTAAALALLAKKYCAEDKSIYTEYRMHRIRNRWMKEQLKVARDELGGLTCAICGKKGLNPWTSDIDNRAVLDHIIEITAGGSWSNPSNFQVACDFCNSIKNDNLQKIRVSV